MPTTIPDFLKILKALNKYEVDFIIVGGVCAVLNGAPISTFDLDLVHSRNDDNIQKLLSALNELDAFFRERPDLRLKSEASHLAATGHLLIMTKHGPLDIPGTIGNGYGYEDLIENSNELRAGKLSVKALSLEKLIEVKEQTMREKDKLAILILKQTLIEKLKNK